MSCLLLRPARSPDLVVSVLPPLISLKLFSFKLLVTPCGQGEVGGVQNSLQPAAWSVTIWSITPGRVPQWVAGRWTGSGPGEQDGPCRFPVGGRGSRAVGPVMCPVWALPRPAPLSGGRAPVPWGQGDVEAQGQRLGSRWSSLGPNPRSPDAAARWAGYTFRPSCSGSPSGQEGTAPSRGLSGEPGLGPVVSAALPRVDAALIA